MLQWRPGSDREILWNDRIKDKFVCHILDVNSGQKRTLENPIYHVHPNGHKALVMDYARLQNLRPGYGYSGIPDKNADILVPNDSYIAVLDLDSGNIENLFSVADITSIDYEDKQPDDDIHYFNCPSWSPDGSRFLLRVKKNYGNKFDQEIAKTNFVLEGGSEFQKECGRIATGMSPLLEWVAG